MSDFHSHRKGITAARLIDELEKLPRDTLIFGFNMADSERVPIFAPNPIDFWDQENGHADINFNAETAVPMNPLADGKSQI
jgi:hypothetical protein